MPTRQEQIDFILDHYDHPRHQGSLEGADIVLEGGNPGCGDIIKLYVKVGPGERIESVSFEGEGCTISQAATSFMTDYVLGKTLAEVNAISQDDILDALGRDVVATRLRCATLALNTLKGAEKQYRNNKAEGKK
jgi:nitrogen fixation NifU-like protein